MWYVHCMTLVIQLGNLTTLQVVFVLHIFSSAGWTNRIAGQKLSVCVCVNQ